MDASGREFGEELPLELAGFNSPQAFVEGIFDASERFSGGRLDDDVTIFVIEREQI
jgi:hypothetical protein